MREVERIGSLDVTGEEIGIYGDWNNPLFTAVDIANWIGHTHTTNMVRLINSNDKTKCKVWNSGQIREMLMLTTLGVRVALANSRTAKAKLLLHQLEDPWRYINTPKETEFALMLRNMLTIHESYFTELNGSCNYIPLADDLAYSDYFAFEEQYDVLGYRVDFYFPNLMLIVEYDEAYHKQQRDIDDKRMSEIVEHIAKRYEYYGVDGLYGEDWVEVIRVDEGDEFRGLVKILTFITSLFVF